MRLSRLWSQVFDSDEWIGRCVYQVEGKVKEERRHA